MCKCLCLPYNATDHTISPSTEQWCSVLRYLLEQQFYLLLFHQKTLGFRFVSLQKHQLKKLTEKHFPICETSTTKTSCAQCCETLKSTDCSERNWEDSAKDQWRPQRHKPFKQKPLQPFSFCLKTEFLWNEEKMEHMLRSVIGNMVLHQKHFNACQSTQCNYFQTKC